MASILGGVGVGCHPLLQRIMFCQNSLLWPVHLGWPCVIGLRASLSYQVLLPQQGSDLSRVKVKEESERAYLRLNIIKTKIMASGPNIAWQTEGEKVEVVTDFFFLGSKITVDSDCSHEIRKCLFLGRKAMTNLDSVLKSRDIARPNKVHIVKAMRNWQDPDAAKDWRQEEKIKPVNLKGNQPWILTGRTDAEDETPVILVI